MASDRSIWDRAMAQGRLLSEPARSGDSGRRPVRSPPASMAPDDRGSAQDHVRSQNARRRPGPDQAMGRADERDLKVRRVKTRKAETRKAESRMDNIRKAGTSKVSHSTAPARRDSAAGQSDVRKAQTALNQQGFDAGDPDGKLGQRTKKALIAFQKKRGFQTTGKVDRITLEALNAGAAQDSREGKPNKNDSTKDSASKDGSRNRGQAPAAAAPQNAPAAPSTTGQGSPAPAPQPSAETPATPDGPQMPNASSRVPAGAPQEDYKDDSIPAGGDR
jgi:peptidoglycan hydrolase-like protein with peptidoglycan-binding domain